MRTIKQSSVRNFLGKAAGGCGGTLHSVLVVLGKKGAHYATGQYSTDVKEPIVWSKAPSSVQERRSREAADGDAPTQGSPTSGEDRARVQQEETAFMTLICHECAAAIESPIGNSVRSVGS
jgi:hypothetical protein